MIKVKEIKFSRIISKWLQNIHKLMEHKETNAKKKVQVQRVYNK